MLLPLKECTNMEDRLSLEGKIVKYTSVNLSSTLNRNEKVEQHIRKKTHKGESFSIYKHYMFEKQQE